ncbi:MobF family relaxase [Tritonibacter mobilis]|uniref:MobF family relaxase n=1 Tax=Tritonibacter mobilis TaxID=379347 RepID=UPI000E0D1FDF|nr:MobF family relaxase [Tritonibacter mobilis]
MMSISNVSAGAAASGYYKEEGYYKAGSEEGQKAATWFGKAAEENGLTGFVDDKQFAQFLDGEAPDGKLMGRYVDGERQHRPGLDLTFSASKSASVAALVIGDNRIIEAHDAAVRSAMTVVEERFIKTRFQQDGEITTKNAEGIIAGIYRHDTSRALDPNLHSHAVIANMAKNENDGFTAIRNEAVFNNRKLITEIYRSDFENRMKEHGIATERGKYGEVNISGIPREVTETFSKRRQEILNALDNKGVEYSADTASKATLATRAAKHKNLDREALRADWRSDALAAGLSRDQLERGTIENAPIAPTAPTPIPRSVQEAEQTPQSDPKEASLVAGIVSWMKNLVAAPQQQQPKAQTAPDTIEGQAVSKAIEHVSERHSVYERSTLTAAALRFSSGTNLEKLDKEIDRRIEAGDLYANGKNGEHLTDRASVAVEKAVLQTWKESEQAPGLDLNSKHAKSGIPDLSATLAKESTLTAGQLAALETSLSGQGRYVGVQGYAGSGKTYMVEKLSELAGQAGYEVKGFAPSLQAVKELDTALPGSSTLARVVNSERNYPQKVDNSRSILLVDESSMVSARDMRSFMDYAERTNAARVVLVGDTKQLDAVSAGQPFAQLQETGMRTAVMDEIRRQRDGTLREAVYDTVRGDIAGAFAKLENNIHKAENPQQAAAEKYLSLPADERSETRILTLTNASRAEINAVVRDGLKQEGSLASEGVTVSGLAPRPRTAVERSDAQSYAAGDILQSLVSSKDHGLSKNALYVVQETDTKTNSLTVARESDGVRLDLPLNGMTGNKELGASFMAYRPEDRELSAGDAVRIRITDKTNDLSNGERAKITSVEDGAIGLETSNGKQIQLNAQSLGARGLEHDYAATAHSVQGETVDRVIVSMNGGDRLATQKGFYVEISRARDEAVLYTDNRAALARNIAENTGIQTTALATQIESQKPREEVLDSVQAVDRAVEHISERDSAYSRGHLTTTALQFAYGSSFDQVDKEINTRIKDGRLFESGDEGGMLTDKASVELERSIIATWQASEKSGGLELPSEQGRNGESLLSRRLNVVRSLTDGQRSSIETALTGEGRYVGIQGYAGTGKTYMLERMSHYAAQAGYDVKGMAPSHQAVHELASVLGSAETLAKITTAERHHPQDVDNSKTILVVDEASMASAKDLRSFMDYAERTGAPRVVLVGDTQQLDSVAAGQPYAQLQNAGMRTAVMDEIRRQRNDDLKAAVHHSIRQEIQPAFSRMEGNVLQVENPSIDAAERYLLLSPSEREGTRILTLTNVSRSEINSVVRDGLWQEGRLKGEEVALKGLQNRQLTETQLADARSYTPGDLVLSVATSKEFGLQKNNLYVVQQSDHQRNRLIVQHEETGEKSILPLDAKFNRRDLGKALVAYDRENREMAAGDQVRFRITDPEAGVTNGVRAEIKSTTGGMIEAKSLDGSTISVPQNSIAARGMEHDYAATAHAVQGESVDRVIVAMNSTERLATQKSFYVEISRARDEAVLLTDDPERLSKTIEKQTGIRPTALDTWMDGRLIGVREQQPEEEKAKDQQQEKAEPEKEKTTRDREPDAPTLPGLFEEKLKEFEKQAELVLQRQKEIER